MRHAVTIASAGNSGDARSVAELACIDEESVWEGFFSKITSCTGETWWDEHLEPAVFAVTRTAIEHGPLREE